MAKMIAALFLFLLAAKSAAESVAAADVVTRDCGHFPFIDRDDPDSGWKKFAADSKLTTLWREQEDPSSSPSSRYHQVLHVRLPLIYRYLRSDGLEGCILTDEFRQFSIRAELSQVSGNGEVKAVQAINFNCQYRGLGISYYLSNSFKVCEIEGSNKLVGDSLYFNITTCSQYKLSFSGKAHNDKDVYPLGSVTVDLPHHIRLFQVDKGLTWTRLAFDENMKNCWTNQTYTITCGSLKLNDLKTNDSFVINNLFPGQKQACTYYQNGLHDQEIKIDLTPKALWGPNTTDMSFTAHDSGIFLIHDQVDGMLRNPNITSSVKVLDMKTNTSFEATGLDAVNYGIVGLRPAGAGLYKACLTLGQLEGACPFGCERETWCHFVTTQPRPEKSSSALWAALAVIFVIVAAMFVLVWMRLDALGAPSIQQVWKNKKEGCVKFTDDLITVGSD